MEKQTYLLRDSNIRRNCIEAIQKLHADSNAPLVVTISERTRSLEQNALLWACLNDVSQQVIWHGRRLAPESWKHLFSASLNGQEAVPNLSGDGFVVLGKSTSKMRVSEMRDLITIIHAFGAEHNVRFSDESARAAEWANRFGATS
ncbi:recombination protein NinB [Pantoea piersonii]|uniref:recombination protein NinB n=1 Tax=Pantoea piersonii TaxID=2364647 RepID=UPI00289DF4D2|nr:recombination protein NinB [Pantoea piersonii]